MSVARSVLAGLCIVCMTVAQDAHANTQTIRILGRDAVTVTGATVHLEDIAEVSSALVSDDESVIALKKLELMASPAPGQKTTVAAMAVLERLRAAAVNLEQIGYRLPSITTVTRAGRQISSDEVRAAIEGVLAVQRREVTIKQLTFEPGVFVAPTTVTLSAEPLFGTSPSQLPFMITAAASGASEVRFKAVATVDEWREVPVAARPLPRGAVVAEDDVVMARMNMGVLPRDFADKSGSIVGLATTSAIGYGETFQRAKLAIPPVITAGSPVTMIVRTDLFEATASGMALESGIEGQEIKVRNESSKKVVTGKVREPGVVIVTPMRSSL